MSVFHKEKIGRASIKEGLDNLPSGICFADQNGTIILCNRQMHRLCHALMGMDLQHISELRGALKNPCKEIIPIDAEALIYRFPNGAAWQFSETAITDAEGAVYTQMQAAEVTALYEKEAELQEKNRALNEANARAKKLYTELDKIVREEENFAVKTHVHDEVGLLLSLSRKLFKQQEDDLAAMRELGKAWSRVSETLGIAEQEAGESGAGLSDAALGEQASVIAGIGVKLTVRGELPQSGNLAYLLTVAIRECATNTVRHAEGSEMTVDISDADGYVCASITNNGKLPEQEVTEGGGLGALRRRIESAGGTMAVESAPVFRLNITLPERGNTV